jgi:hypothetical protein
MIELRPGTPSFFEAMQRYARELAMPIDPPLSPAERVHIAQSCLHGGCIFLRCTFYLDVEQARGFYLAGNTIS